MESKFKADAHEGMFGNGPPPGVYTVEVMRECVLLEHAVTAEPLYSRSRDPLSYTGNQVSLPRKVVVSQVFNLRGNYTQGAQQSIIIPDMDTN